MEMEAKGQAKLMIKVRQYKSELGKFKQTVVSTRPLPARWLRPCATRPLLRNWPDPFSPRSPHSGPHSLTASVHPQASTPASDRDALLSSGPTHQAYEMDLDDTDTGLSSAQTQRSRLLQSTSVLDSSSARLDNAQAMSAESEAVGAGILQSLFGQRIQLETARDGLDEADGSIGRAQGTIKKMVRQ